MIFMETVLNAAALERSSAAVNFWRKSRRWVLPLAALGMGVGAWLERPPGTSSSAKVSARWARVIGRVAGHPRRTASGDVFLLRIHWMHSGGASVNRPATVRVVRSGPGPAFNSGDLVSVQGPLRWGDFEKDNGILWAVPGRGYRISSVSAWDPRRWVAAVRRSCRESFSVHLGDDRARLLAGIVLGERPPPGLKIADDFRRSGTYHLLVASGTNVGFVAALWWALTRWGLWWPRRWALASLPLAAFFYAGLAGADPPVLRAALMASAASMAALLDRWNRPTHALLLSAGIILALDPNALFQPGFQMSFTATFALLLAWPRSQDQEEGVQPRGWRHRGLRTVLRLALTSFAAQVSLAPILLHYFGRFSWAGFVANLVSVPLAEAALGLGAGLAFLHSVWPTAASFWAVPTGWVLSALSAWTAFCASWPGAELAWRVTAFPALGAGGAIFLALAAARRRPLRWTVGLGSFVIAVGILAAGGQPRPALEIRWSGGRIKRIVVETPREAFTVHLSTGGRSPLTKSGNNPLVEPVAGPVWTEGPARVHVVRPPGPGFALDIQSPAGKTLVAVGLSRAQQKALLKAKPSSVTVLGWTPHGQGPPTDALLLALAPSRIVYQGPRLPAAVRARASDSVVVDRAGAAGYSLIDDGAFQFVEGRR